MTAPLVRPSAEAWERWVKQSAGRNCCAGAEHYEIALGPRVSVLCVAMRRNWRESTSSAPDDRRQILPAQRGANAARRPRDCGSRTSAYILDPWKPCARCWPRRCNAAPRFRQLDVEGLRPRGGKIEILSEAPAWWGQCAGVRRRAFRPAARTVRIARAAAGRARLSRRNARAVHFFRCARCLRRCAHRGHAHERTRARDPAPWSLRILMRLPMGASPAPAAAHCARSAMPASSKARAGWARALRPIARLPCRNRPRAGTGKAVLFHRPSAHSD